MTNPLFTDKFIAFVDVLGFKGLVQAAEAGTGMPLSELLAALKYLGTAEDQRRYEVHGPMVCPGTPHLQPDLNFRLTQVSDCVIVSAEVSPCGVINLIGHCWAAVIQLLSKGIMCRGYITRGAVYHVDGQFIGSGYMNAYAHERQVAAFKRRAEERGTPFVEVDPEVCEYIAAQDSKCVKEFFFSRYVASDGTVTALFPFQQLAPSWMFEPKSDGMRERQLIGNWRTLIGNLRQRVLDLVDRSNPDAVTKAEHYVAALDRQLHVCGRADYMLDLLYGPSRRRTKSACRL